jgi:hypothetical protein
MKNFTIFLILLCTWYFVLGTNYSFASERNIFGLHLTQIPDLENAAKIINSQNGDWGWATIVIRLDQLDKNTWQNFFNLCRKLHVIPIVRLATIMENDNWKKPEYSDIDSLAEFLNSLNWPTTSQHIILFNEPNHASEWGGGVDPKNFADLSIYAYQKFKKLKPNFYILSGALDLAAPNQKDKFVSASTFYRDIFLYKPEYFDNVDAIASHSYPNHGFVGTPSDTGQHSIRGYAWELNYLKTLGIKNTYPVFITETGWPHREGSTTNNSYYSSTTSANFLITALQIWSKDNRIQAVTPFIYNYPNEPFDHFSWLNKSESIYPAYQKVINLAKQKNAPSQISSYQLINNFLPFIILTDTDYSGKIILKNTGQSIWGETKFCLLPQTTQNVELETLCASSNLVYPGQLATFEYKLKIKNMPEFKDKTFISWENLPPLEITTINGSGTIYSPKTTLKQKLIQFFQSWFI